MTQPAGFVWNYPVGPASDQTSFPGTSELGVGRHGGQIPKVLCPKFETTV